jgi:PKD repeat protein
MFRRVFPLFVFFFLASFFTLYSQSAFPAHFSFGVENLPANFNTFKLLLPDKNEIAAGRYVRFIRTEKLISTENRALLAASGIHILEYVPGGIYLVSIPEYYDLTQLERVQVQSIMPVQPVWKLARNLRERPFGDWAVSGDRVAVNVQIYPHVELAVAAELCKKNGWGVVKKGSNSHFIQLLIRQEELESAAALPFIQWMELIPPPAEPEDTKGRSLHRSNLLDSDAPSGKKYNGDGVNVLVRDDGQLGPHIDFAGRLTNLTSQPPDAGTHGDGVAGILTGAGNLDPNKKGMAAGAQLYAIDYTSDFQDQTLDLFLEENVTITNSSYSNGCNSGYTMSSRITDEQLYEHPTLMHVFSAGNANGDDCGTDNYGAGNQWANITGGHKQGKNSISAANLNSTAALDNTSSRGPAYDGRLKPDISANGTNQESTSPFNNYQVFGGTSGAAPGIAGCLAQLTHAYKSLHNQTEPAAALLKTLMLNTANDLGNAGPDYKFGWGHVNAGRALNLIEENQWSEGSVDNEATYTQTLLIPDGVRQAKIMLYWPEAPASEFAPKALINDLDISVTGNNLPLYLPWKLDPTPDPVILNTPAGKGRDSLNNVEQVAIDNPVAGVYTISVKGMEVPMGPQPFYLAWEFLTDQVALTYPNGGEGFAPGETQRIHWDAFGNSQNFVLSYSTDNGANWQTITTVVSTARMYDWVVPATASGKVRIQLQRGSFTDTNDLPFSIVPVPQNIGFEKVCLDSITLTWTDVQDTLSYDVYLLGSKYMEIVQSTAANSATFAITSPQLEKWVSVRSATENGIAGRRAIAVNWPGGLKNCPAPDDLGLNISANPQNDTILACAPVNYSVQVEVKNSGLNLVANATVNYQIDNQPVISALLPALPVGQAFNYVFPNPILLSGNNNVQVKIWVTYAPDDYIYNDTVTYALVYVTDPVDTYFTENFQSSSVLPSGWLIVNPDAETDGLTWTLETDGVTGINGAATRALYLNCFSYNEVGEEDYVYMPPLDLHNLPHPGLKFDVAHAQYNSTYTESLRVEVFTNCDPGSTPVVVWEKTDPQLATTASTTASFKPDNAADWRTEYIDLQQFEGQSVFVRFASVNDYGNNIFLDNINLFEFDVEAPEALLSVSMDTVCRGDTVIFQALGPISPSSTYAWQFSAGASPLTATGPGPHAVRYLLAGSKTPRLIVSNVLGADTAVQQVLVKPLPTTNFTFSASDLNVTFTNTTANGINYLWSFGDGDTSTAANPVHLFPAPGNYVVRLTATNECGIVEKVTVVVLTSATSDLSGHLGVRVLPNPNAGDFHVELKGSESGPVTLSLLDMQGRLIERSETTVHQSVTDVHFKKPSLDKGVYQLLIQSETGSATYRVVVQ